MSFTHWTQSEQQLMHNVHLDMQKWSRANGCKCASWKKTTDFFSFINVWQGELEAVRA